MRVARGRPPPLGARIRRVRSCYVLTGRPARLPERSSELAEHVAAPGANRRSAKKVLDAESDRFRINSRFLIGLRSRPSRGTRCGHFFGELRGYRLTY